MAGPSDYSKVSSRLGFDFLAIKEGSTSSSVKHGYVHYLHPDTKEELGPDVAEKPNVLTNLVVNDIDYPEYELISNVNYIERSGLDTSSSGPMSFYGTVRPIIGYRGGVYIEFDEPFTTLPTVIVTPNLVRGEVVGPFVAYATGNSDGDEMTDVFDACIKNKLESFIYEETDGGFGLNRKVATPKCIVESIALDGCYVKCGMFISDIYSLDGLDDIPLWGVYEYIPMPFHIMAVAGR